VPALSSVGSAPDHQKYPMNNINEPTPCTLLDVKGRTLRTIEVVDAIVMATRIMHGWPILPECAVVEVITIREGHEFEDLDYPYEEEGIEKLKDAKGNFILWPHKDIILKICSLLIVLLQSREDESTLTSQNIIGIIVRFTPPSQNPPQTTTPLKIPPSTQPLEHHSPQHHYPPHVHSAKPPPHTTPPLQNPPNALKKWDAIVDSPSKDPKKQLEDLALEGMTVEEFLQHGDKDYREFEYGKPLV
jgi:hypothetical protein